MKETWYSTCKDRPLKKRFGIGGRMRNGRKGYIIEGKDMHVKNGTPLPVHFDLLPTSTGSNKRKHRTYQAQYSITNREKQHQGFVGSIYLVLLLSINNQCRSGAGSCLIDGYGMKIRGGNFTIEMDTGSGLRYVGSDGNG
jgi:hypothetical protein